MKYKPTREIKIGVVVVVCLAACIWGFAYLKGKNLFSSHRTYKAVYVNVSGLRPSSPVQINGYKVGSVSNIQLISSRDGLLLVTFRVSNSDVVVTTDTRAKIISTNLLGGKAIELIIGNSKQLAEPGDTLESEIALTLRGQFSQMVLPIKQKLEGLMSSIDSILAPIQTVLTKKGTKTLGHSLERLPQIFDNIYRITKNLDELVASEKTKISRILSDLEGITDNLDKNKENISQVLANLNTITDSLSQSNLKQTIASINATMENLESITQKIETGKGTLGMLVNNDSLYKRVNSALGQLESLLKDLEENPERYVNISLINF